jgi:hypothetical protein
LFAPDLIEMTDNARAEVRLNIGVPGRIASATVPQGTTVRQALAQFGISTGAHQIRGWKPGGDKKSRQMTLDDKIETDMIVLLLQSIVGRAPPKGVIESVIREKLGKPGLRDIFVQPFDDYDGEDSLRVTVVLDQPAVDRLDGETAIDLIVQLRRQLEEKGESRFPVIEYATRKEIEDSAVVR